MADYQRKVIRRLKQAGCVRIRQGKGDHENGLDYGGAGVSVIFNSLVETIPSAAT